MAKTQNDKLIYIILGDGGCRESMELACKQERLTQYFRFIGWVDHGQVVSYLNLADIVVMPSETETQSLVCLEAQACGRVLLASDIEASKALIINGVTGVLFRKGDICDLSEKTLEIAENNKLRATIGKNARLGVQEHSIDRVARMYESLLRSVVE
ncbi:MAG: glycosyltransferase [Pirellulales bacterium]